MKLNLFLIDDHSLFREGLKFLLSHFDFIENIYEAENGMQFISALKSNTPADIALLDIEMPVMNGIDATRQALLIRPELKIIALSMYSEESYYSSMIDAGAVGFLMKNSNFSEVKKAISDVWEGKNYFSSEILQSILTRVKNKKQQNINEEITERETEILFYICKGLSNAEIARELTISKRTVDKHRENLLEKTMSKNTANLVIFAIKNGYFSI
jgi:DNA-binding NarL/FixJ family response regulator